MLDALQTYLLQPAITATILAGVAFIAREAASSYIKEGIAHQFRAEIERLAADLRWQAARRQKAEQVAAVITEWLSLTYNPNKCNDPGSYLALQKSYWELALWLDAETVRVLNSALLLKRGAHYKDALAAVRSAIVGDEDAPIQPYEFVHWQIPGYLDSAYDQKGPSA